MLQHTAPAEHDAPTDLLSGGGVRALAILVWPVLVEQFLMMLVGLSDAFLAGHWLEEPHLVAMTTMLYLLWLLQSLFSVVAIGVTALTARFTGAQDLPSAVRATNQAVLLGVAMAIGITIACWLGRDAVAGWMGLEGLSAVAAKRFLTLLIPVLPAMMFELVGIAALRGAGDMVTGLATMLLVNVVNVGVSWLLLHGVGPIPPQGWDAICIGAGCGYAVGGVVVLAVLLRGRRGFRLRSADLLPDAGMIRRILWVGLPSGIDVLSLTVLQLFFLAMINQLGDTAAAAHGVAIRIESLSYLPANAFAIAAATLAGQYLGAGDRAGAQRSVLTACAAGLIIMIAIAAAMYVFAEPLAGFFLSADRGEVCALSAALLRIIVLALPPLVVLNVLTGALRGAGDTRWPLAITLVGFVGLRLPVAYYLLFSTNCGVRGAWYAMALDITLRCALTVARFAQGGWKDIAV